MANEYDEEVSDRKELVSTQESEATADYKPSKSRTLTTGTIKDVEKISNHNITTTSRIKDLENELGIHDGLSGLLATAGTKDELFEELLKQQRSQMFRNWLALDTKERAYQKRFEEIEQRNAERFEELLQKQQRYIDGFHSNDEPDSVQNDGDSNKTDAIFPKRPHSHLPLESGHDQSLPTSSTRVMQRLSTRRLATKAKQSSDMKYPEDCYSFIALNGPVKGQPQTLERTFFFLYGLLPFIFQIVMLVLLAYSQTNELRGTVEETDNPDQDKVGNWSLFAKFIQANSTPIIRVAQVTSLAAYAIFPDSSVKDILRAIQLYPCSSKENESGTGYIRLSCILRLIQGTTAVVATLLLVLTSVTVVDIILNFTAVNFISDLDDYAFAVAKEGEFSPALQEEAERVANTDLPPCMFTNRQSKWKSYQWVAVLVAAFLLGMTSAVFVFQDSTDVWVTELMRVQFQDEGGLSEYSGCFGMNTKSSSVEFSRRKYHSYRTGPPNTTFGYCRKDRKWVFFKGDASDPCAASNDTSLLLARSAKTDTYDISTMFEESWVSASNTPIELYFFDGSNEDDMHCNLTLDDGNCDPVFNNFGYAFDGGDCCAATCTKPNCGRGGLTTFGDLNVDGDGYDNCENPAMLPITIRLNEITSSRNPKNTTWNQLSDAPEKWRWENDENVFEQWKEDEPLNSYFSLDCDGKNVMTVYIHDTMANQAKTVYIEDGARCTGFVRSTNIIDVFNDPPIWNIGYTIFHDGAFVNDNLTKTVEILSSQSSEVETVTFTRIPECYFKKLHGHVDIDSIYTGNSATNQAINWLLQHPDPKQQCEASDFIERYALVKMNFAMNSKKPFISRDRKCRWRSINCNEGNIVSILLSSKGLEGCLSTELGLIQDIQRIQLNDNQLTSLPAEIGNLTSLQELDLSENQIGSLPAEIVNLSNLKELDLFENQIRTLSPEIGNLAKLTSLSLISNELQLVPSEIGYLTSLKYLSLTNNTLTLLPSQIGKLTSLTYLYLRNNTLTLLPSQIGKLTSLVYLSLRENQLNFLPTQIGELLNLQNLYLTENKLDSLPSEIGNLFNSQKLFFAENHIGSLPTQIGNLSKLRELNMSSNKLTSLPGQIGNLTNLQKLYLTSNTLGSLPAEIGNLASLKYLSLRNNKLTSLPAQIGELTSLTYLSLRNNQLNELPKEIGKLINLRELTVPNNNLNELPKEIGNLSNLKRLVFDKNISVPDEVKSLCGNSTVCTT